MTWANNDYGYRMKINIDKTKVAADLTDFPILISVTDVDLKDTGNGGHVQNSSGYDIVFYDANDSTLLSHELVSYVNTTGEVEFWVKKPVLDCDANDAIYMYYGKSGVVANQSSTSTWNSAYKVVYHMNDLTTSTIKDSTANANNASKTAANNPVEATGKIGKGQTFAGDDVISQAITGISGVMSLSCWMKTSGTATQPRLINFARAAASGIDLGHRGSTAPSAGKAWADGNANANTNNMASTTTVNDNVWHLINFIKSTTTQYNLYVDDGAVEVSEAGSNLEYSRLFIGVRYDSSSYFTGTIDEVRVSNTNLSSNWILTEYANQNSPATFMSYDAEETKPSGGTAWTKSLTETLSMSDVAARTAVFNRTVSDNLSLSDLISKKPGKEFTETLTISDDFDYLRILLLANTLSISDARSFLYGKNLSNTLSISDNIITLKEIFKTLLETLSISDSTVMLKYICRQLSDTLSISDDFDYLRGFDIYDTMLFSDSMFFDYEKVLSNTLTLNDLIRKTTGYIRTVDDILSISDSCITSLYTAYFKTLTETLSLNDLIRTRTYFNRTISETLTMTETFIKAVHKILGDTVTINELVLLLKESAYLFSIHDTLQLVSAISILKNQTLALSDTVSISDLIMAISSKDMEFQDSTGTVLVYLRRPYWDNLDGSLNFNSLGFAFRSGNYTAYIEDINDESITFTGYESANDVLTRFNKISAIADNGTEITISLLGTIWDSTYVVSSFTYRPISLDVFEYTITLKLVR